MQLENCGAGVLVGQVNKSNKSRQDSRLDPAEEEQVKRIGFILAAVALAGICSARFLQADQAITGFVRVQGKYLLSPDGSTAYPSRRQFRATGSYPKAICSASKEVHSLHGRSRPLSTS